MPCRVKGPDYACERELACGDGRANHGCPPVPRASARPTTRTATNRGSRASSARGRPGATRWWLIAAASEDQSQAFGIHEDPVREHDSEAGCDGRERRECRRPDGCRIYAAEGLAERQERGRPTPCFCEPLLPAHEITLPVCAAAFRSLYRYYPLPVPLQYLS
jgi:hypothetical protein